MPFIENVDDLAEWLADAVGIYGTGQAHELPDDAGHAETCPCRLCWTIGIKDRIRKAVQHEQEQSVARYARYLSYER